MLEKEEVILLGLQEDIGNGDITSNTVIPEDAIVKAKIVAKQDGILCGIELVKRTFLKHDEKIEFESLKKDGEGLKKNDVVARISGSARSILACERTAVNLLMRLSGIATNTARFVEAIKPHNTKLLDTRKTTPGYRVLEKHAVRCGGGKNHRMGLYDGVLVKNTHIAIAGSVKEAVEMAKKAGKPVEVEVRTLAELKEALEAGAETVLLDNMTIEDIKKAVRMTNGRAKLEASGGITLENINRIAATGVDYISVGSALTLSAPALDFSLEIMKVR